MRDKPNSSDLRDRCKCKSDFNGVVEVVALLIARAHIRNSNSGFPSLKKRGRLEQQKSIDKTDQ